VYMPSIGFILIFVVAYEMVFDWFERRAKPAAKNAA
jgi:hypothetical protein